MSIIEDEISPSYIRDKRIDLTLDQGTLKPAARQAVLVNVSYERTLPDFVIFPLIFELQGPNAESYQRRVYNRVAPTSLQFIPREGGPHTVTLREAFHNRWWGSLSFDVSGDLLRPLPIP